MRTKIGREKKGVIVNIMKGCSLSSLSLSSLPLLSPSLSLCSLLLFSSILFFFSSLEFFSSILLPSKITSSNGVTLPVICARHGLVVVKGTVAMSTSPLFAVKLSSQGGASTHTHKHTHTHTHTYTHTHTHKHHTHTHTTHTHGIHTTQHSSPFLFSPSCPPLLPPQASLFLLS